MRQRSVYFLLSLWLASSAALAFEGQYSSQGRKLKITRQGEAYRVDLNASGDGCIATHTAAGSLRGEMLVSTEGKGAGACVLQTRQTGAGVTVSESPGCANYRGMRCQDFAGSYARTGGAPAARSAASGKSGWATVVRGGRTDATARNGSGSAVLVISCAGPSGRRFLSLSMQGVPKGFKSAGLDDAIRLGIGESGFAIMFEGSHEEARVSLKQDTPEGRAALFSAFGRGGIVQITGRPFSGVKEADRTFNAAGGAAPIAALQASCR